MVEGDRNGDAVALRGRLRWSGGRCRCCNCRSGRGRGCAGCARRAASPAAGDDTRGGERCKIGEQPKPRSCHVAITRPRGRVGSAQTCEEMLFDVRLLCRCDIQFHRGRDDPRHRLHRSLHECSQSGGCGNPDRGCSSETNCTARHATHRRRRNGKRPRPLERGVAEGRGDGGELTIELDAVRACPQMGPKCRPLDLWKGSSSRQESSPRAFRQTSETSGRLISLS